MLFRRVKCVLPQARRACEFGLGDANKGRAASQEICDRAFQTHSAEYSMLDPLQWHEDDDAATYGGVILPPILASLHVSFCSARRHRA